MVARCRHRQKVGRLTTSARHHPEMVGAKKKDDTIKFIIDNLNL